MAAILLKIVTKMTSLRLREGCSGSTTICMVNEWLAIFQSSTTGEVIYSSEDESGSSNVQGGVQGEEAAGRVHLWSNEVTKMQNNKRRNQAIVSPYLQRRYHRIHLSCQVHDKMFVQHQQCNTFNGNDTERITLLFVYVGFDTHAVLNSR